MCTGSHNKSTNEALVRFTDKQQRDLALKRNGTKFGSRNLEVSIRQYLVFMIFGNIWELQQLSEIMYTIPPRNTNVYN